MNDIHDTIEMENIRVNDYISRPQSVKAKEPLWAQIASIVLHPLLMPTYGLCLLFVYTNFGVFFANQFWTFFAPVFLLSCVIPASGVYVLYKLDMVTSLDLKNKDERSLPFLIGVLSYGTLVYYFWLSFQYSVVYFWIIAMFVAPLLLLIICATINLRWKISLHMAGVGALLGGVLSICYNVIYSNQYYLFIILFILAGILGVARLILSRHTPAQVYAGFLLGFFIAYICIWAAQEYALHIIKVILNL